MVLVTHKPAIGTRADRGVRLHGGGSAQIETNHNPAPVAELNW